MTTIEMLRVKVRPTGEVLVTTIAGECIVRCVIPNNPLKAIKTLRRTVDALIQDKEVK